jgi:hypothetical protein
MELREEAKQRGISVYALLGEQIIEEREEQEKKDKEEWDEFLETLFN